MYFRSFRRSVAAAALCALCAVVALLYLHIHRRPSPEGAPLGEKISIDEALTDAKGMHDGEMGRRGKHILLFFTTWCDHCRHEIVNLERVRSHRRNDIMVVGISLDGEEATIGLMKELNVTMPFVIDEQGKMRRILRVRTVPALYCFDEANVLQRFETGEHSLTFDEKVVDDFVGSSLSH